MPEEAEIQKLIKKAHNAKLPEWKKNYLKKIADNLMVHTKGTLFSKVDTLFPNEHPDSKAHCINSYEPITKGSIWKGINDVIRIFSNSSFSVSASDKTLEWANNPDFDGTTLFSWFLEKWVNEAIAKDPNALCAIYPDGYEDKENAALIRFIKSEHVLIYPDGELCAFISEEESDVEYSTVENIVSRQYFYDELVDTLNARTVVEKTFNQRIEANIKRKVYHVFTKEFFLKFPEPEVTNQFEFEYIEYPKPVNALPVFGVSGGPELLQSIYESFVSPFIPFGNLALLSHRNHRAVDLMFSYPRMSEIQTPCDNIDCNEGYIVSRIISAGDDGRTTCPRCKGSQFITAQSPYKVYQRKIETGLTDPDLMKAMMAASPVEFHTPDTSILEYSKKEWKGYLAMGEEAIFVPQEIATGNVKSAESKKLDHEGKYSWLQNISKVFYDRLRMLMQAKENYSQSNPTKVTVEAPSSFAVLTETESFEALNFILTSQALVMIKAQQVENFINKFVSKSSPIIKALKILKQFDPLLFYSNSDVQTFKSNNAVSSESWSRHIYGYPVLMQLYEKDKKLFDKDASLIIKLLQEEIDTLMPADDLKAAIKTKAGI